MRHKGPFIRDLIAATDYTLLALYPFPPYRHQTDNLLSPDLIVHIASSLIKGPGFKGRAVLLRGLIPLPPRLRSGR